MCLKNKHSIEEVYMHYLLVSAAPIIFLGIKVWESIDFDVPKLNFNLDGSLFQNLTSNKAKLQEQLLSTTFFGGQE